MMEPSTILTHRKDRELPEPPPVWTIGEQTTMGDGQLGSEMLDAGPEEANPEGSALIARVRERRDGQAAQFP